MHTLANTQHPLEPLLKKLIKASPFPTHSTFSFLSLCQYSSLLLKRLINMNLHSDIFVLTSEFQQHVNLLKVILPQALDTSHIPCSADFLYHYDIFFSPLPPSGLHRRRRSQHKAPCALCGYQSLIMLFLAPTPLEYMHSMCKQLHK